MTLREILLYASSATVKEYYALDYFRHSTGAVASRVGRARSRRFHSYPLGNCGDRFTYPANPRESSLKYATVTSNADFQMLSRQPIIIAVANY